MRAAALLVPALVLGVLVSAQWRAQQDRSEIAVRYSTPLTEAASSLQREQDGPCDGGERRRRRGERLLRLSGGVSERNVRKLQAVRAGKAELSPSL